MVAALSLARPKKNMISGNNEIVIRKAEAIDLDDIKTLADQHKRELGFIIRGALQKSIDSGEVLIAINPQRIVCGFVQFRHRKDEQTTLYNIVVIPSCRMKGLARHLIGTLVIESKQKQKAYIQLKCPVELPANDFYHQCGFSLVEREEGKHRQLNIWRLLL